MKRFATILFAMLFLSLGTLFADNVPADPIIDIENGTGTIAFHGSTTFTITDNSTDCVFASRGIDSCVATTPTFGNVTGLDITRLRFDFPTTGPNQGIFTAAARSPFQTVDTVVPGFDAIYSGGDITHNCTVGEGVFCDPESDFKTSEFTVGFAKTLVPIGGSIVIGISAVPEPPAAALMFTGICLVWAGRRWL